MKQHLLLQKAIKRVIDFHLSLFLLILFSPLFLLISLLGRYFLGKPVIFRQVRSGLQGKPFLMYKFRTMLEKNDCNGTPLPDDQRLTPFGTFLRATSLDELPQILNILLGDMSFVGPRPLLPEYVPLYSEFHSLRLNAPPGILGWAQINGRNSISWEEKFNLDVWYVQNFSLLLDIEIFFKGFKTFFSQNDISFPNHVTMPKYTGSLNQLPNEKF
ncbi:MAG: sugar transferase [Candidatus Riflebacteria bacterium]|nr:sugar transferase [Candidatus Riflebacteria bacterium]